MRCPARGKQASEYLSSFAKEEHAEADSGGRS
jgi:hypothetical protein